MSSGLKNLSPESEILLILKVVTGLSSWKDYRTGVWLYVKESHGRVEELEAAPPIQDESEWPDLSHVITPATKVTGKEFLKHPIVTGTHHIFPYGHKMSHILS